MAVDLPIIPVPDQLTADEIINHYGSPEAFQQKVMEFIAAEIGGVQAEQMAVAQRAARAQAVEDIKTRYKSALPPLPPPATP